MQFYIENLPITTYTLQKVCSVIKQGFCDQLGDIIFASGYTQLWIADQISVSPSYISHWTVGRRIPSFEHLYKLILMLKVVDIQRQILMSNWQMARNSHDILIFIEKQTEQIDSLVVYAMLRGLMQIEMTNRFQDRMESIGAWGIRMGIQNQKEDMTLWE